MITYVLSGLLVVLGLVIVIQTLAAGIGGGLGLLIGALFILAGAARLYLQRQRG
ncbi:MAG TPA: hypothetical protein VHH31_01100 [Gaiellaceae bacterium]|jgi:hypothetical protein|nr:hypothetical protein [Gaiellaceae bacterium]